MKVHLNSALGSLHGKIEGYVFRRYRGKQILQKTPTFTQPWGAGTLAQRKEFGGADAWYKSVIKPNPDLVNLYRERGKKKQLNYRQMALRDFFNPPTIDGLYLSDYRPADGGLIKVSATDDFEVRRERDRRR